MANLIRGTTVDEKFESLEKILQSFQRRLSTKVISLLPPVPLIQYNVRPDIDGLLCEFLIPVQGSLSRLCLYSVDTPPTYTCSLTVIRGTTTIIYDFTVKSQREVISIDYLVVAGDLARLTVSPPDAIHSAIVALLIVPSAIGQLRQETYLLEEFLRLEEQENASESETIV